MDPRFFLAALEHFDKFNVDLSHVGDNCHEPLRVRDGGDQVGVLIVRVEFCCQRDTFFEDNSLARSSDSQRTIDGLAERVEDDVISTSLAIVGAGCVDLKLVTPPGQDE